MRSPPQVRRRAAGDCARCPITLRRPSGVVIKHNWGEATPMTKREKDIVMELIEAARSRNEQLISILLFRLELAEEAAHTTPTAQMSA